MPAPENVLKQKLASGQQQIGCWLGTGEPYVAEMAATCGFDVLVIDAEHAPVDLGSLMGQLKALEHSPSAPLVRLTADHAHLVKQALDLGAQSLMIPMIESAEQAAAMVRAVRYPPRGVRGVGAGMGRASRFSTVADYLATAEEQICLMLQVESRSGLDALDDILAVEGIDLIFVGPADLSASLGYSDEPYHPRFRAVVEDVLVRIRAAGRAAGILETREDYARKYLSMGVEFVATAVDVMLYTDAMRRAAARYTGTVETPSAPGGY